MEEHSTSLVQRKATCPHCWHAFYADEALYVSRHAELYGDPVLGDHENRRYAPHEITRDGNGALDPMGWKMTERACPRCHLQIPIELLLKPPHFISLVGAPRSGKTYFITSMLHYLRRTLAKYFSISLQSSDSHDVKAFMEYERTLFGAADPSLPTALQKTQEQGALYNIVRLDGVDVQLPKPFIFALRPTEASTDVVQRSKRLPCNLIFYDNAGESFDFLKEKAGNVRVTQHLSRCDTVLFAYDPLQHPDARVRLCNSSRDPQVTAAAVTHRQESILEEVANRMRRHRQGTQNKLLAPPLVVCVQKYDVWKSLVPSVRDASGEEMNLIDHSSVEYIKKHGIAGLDIAELNLISILVRAFLHDLSPEFVAHAEANFEVVRYFPVSALGTSPLYESVANNVSHQMLKVRPVDISPFRVEHPMLWLLHRWKLIPAAHRKSDYAQQYPHAEIESVSGGRLRVISPLTKRVIVLDLEYAGSRVLDSEAGSLFWIPNLSTRNAEAAQAPRPAQKAQSPPPLKLGQREPPKKPKRGWFS